MVKQEYAHLKDLVSGADLSELPEGLLRELETVRGADVLCGTDPELDRAIEDAARICPDLRDRLPNHAFSLFFDASPAKSENEDSVAVYARVARASEAAARICESEGAPARKRWAQMREQLCCSLRVLGELSEEENESRRLLARAVEAGEDAFQIFAECDRPRESAVAKGHLAHVLRIQASMAKDREESGRILARAIVAAEGARATLEHGLGNQQDQSQQLLNALSMVQLDGIRIFDGEDPGRNPARAVEEQKAALDKLIRKDDPQAYALAQEQLGLARSSQAELETGKEARRMHAAAAEAFEAASHIRSEKDAPARWAQCIAWLASSLRSQAESSGRSASARLYERAAGAYESALRVYTPEKFSKESIYYHEMLAEVLLARAALGEFGNVRQPLQRARKVYQRAIPIAAERGAPLDKARLQIGLVSTLRKLAFCVSADKAMRLYRQALEHCEEASGIFDREARPENRLKARVLLAAVFSETAYRCMNVNESVELFDRSIRIYEDGLKECEGPGESQRAGILRNLNKTREERDFRASSIS